jgi:hypothetical protein
MVLVARWTCGIPLLAILSLKLPVSASFSWQYSNRRDTTSSDRFCAAPPKRRLGRGRRSGLHPTPRQSACKSAFVLCAAAPKDWDAILAQEDDDDDDDDQGSSSVDTSWLKSPADMVYNQRNCDRSNDNFAAIVGAGGPAADVYGSVATKNAEAIFWFLGKVAHVSDVTLEQCVARQWNLIQQHAANLRPLDLYPAVTSRSLDLWCAPANSELDVAYNRPKAKFTKMSSHVPDAAGIKNVMVGFQGEVYDRGEDGFRTWRLTANGMPARPEFAGPVEEEEDDDDDEEGRAPTDEEMAQIQKALEGKDINQVYEEQEQRRNDSK